MRLLITILLLIFVNVSVADAKIYLREDGGNPSQCDGTHDKPLAGAKDTDPNDKNTIPDCAWNNKTLTVTATSLGQDIIQISQGTVIISVRQPPIAITLEQFIGNPKKYTDMVLADRVVFINNYNGKQRRLLLE